MKNCWLNNPVSIKPGEDSGLPFRCAPGQAAAQAERSTRPDFCLILFRSVSCRPVADFAFAMREGEGLRNYNRSCWAYRPDPDERRARGPHSLAGSLLPPLKVIRRSPHGSNPLHINAGSASVIPGRPCGRSPFFPDRRFCRPFRLPRSVGSRRRISAPPRQAAGSWRRWRWLLSSSRAFRPGIVPSG